MNKIKFLLCFALVVSGVEGRGQIYINSYRFQGAQQLLLDAYPTAEAAFSLRKLREAYTGNCITIRRASNGDTTNIGFVDNYLDTATLKTFCSGTNCFVRRWYDQSGNGRDAVQTTDANQPTIATAGVIFYKNGTPSLDFDGTNDRFDIPSSTAMFNFLHNGNSSAIFSLHHIDVDATLGFFGNNATTGSAIGISMYSFTTFNITVAINKGSSPQPASTTGVNNTIGTNSFICNSIIDADNATAAERLKTYINGGANSISTNTLTGTPTTSNATYSFQIGATGNNAFGLNGGFKELIIYNSDQSANRTAIRDNINTFYSIY